MLKGGYTGITLSVCPSVDRIVSALYLQQYSSDPFHICTSYQATSEGVSRVMPVSKLKNLKFWRIFKICNFDFVFFWLGIQYDSIVWVIIRRRGVSSERRRSSCSSSGLFYWHWGYHYQHCDNVSDIIEMHRNTTLQWLHNGRDSVSNHQPHGCLLNRLFRRRSKKTPKLCITGLCAGNSPVTGEFKSSSDWWIPLTKGQWYRHFMFY